MKITKGELKKVAQDCADVEIYYSNNSSIHSFDTDYIRDAFYYEIDCIDDLPEEIEGDYCEMSEDDYNSSILSNTCEYANFAEWYGNKDAKVLCVLIY